MRCFGTGTCSPNPLSKQCSTLCTCARNSFSPAGAPMKRWIALAAVLVTVLIATAAPPQDMAIVADRATGIYAAGETVRWTITWSGDGEPPSARYMLKHGG